ncbi:aldehyde dehydrogenase [Rhodococcus wratislaviensis]|uniref:aldehyde dehydrogenase n=1 Tax=Rhodococcus wratislaviensis TaxID=44752 RepID=UPI003662BD50
MLVYNHLFIGGNWVVPDSTTTFEVISPSTEECVGRSPNPSLRDMEQAVAAAREAFDEGPWPRMTPQERAEVLRRIRDGMLARATDFGGILADEAGLPVTTWGSVASPVGKLEYFADLIERYNFAELREGRNADVIVRSHPVGVVAAIVPWNSPLSVGFMKLAPALAAGCTVIFKTDQNIPLHTYLLGEVLQGAGLPPGVVNLVPGDPVVSEALVSHTNVDKVSFTGSTATGRRVGEICGRSLKRCTLELGGKSAAIVLDDVNLEGVIGRLAGATALNNGQACVLQSRVIAPRGRYNEVVAALGEALAKMQVGDPHDPKTAFGPLINARQRDRVESYVEIGRSEGANVVLGGGRPSALDRGYFVEPTLLRDVDNSMRIAQEEVFGPVIAVIPYDDEEEAVAIANDSPYGLSGTVWTGDINRGLATAAKVRTGNFGVNLFAMENCAPFGGVKQSGYGWENGPEGLHAFLSLESIHVPKGTPVGLRPEGIETTT